MMMVRIACWNSNDIKIQIILLTYLLPACLLIQTSKGQIIKRYQSTDNNSNKLKTTFSEKFSSFRQQTNKQLKARALQTESGANARKPSISVTVAASIAAAVSGLPGADDEYKCAKYCTCSVIQIIERAKGQSRTNLTQAKCESNLFSDVLTIDRRTQIIHISLPISDNGNNDIKSVASQDGDSTSLAKNEQNKIQKSSQSFRMPRLVQFNILKEIIIINLRFEVCDSEVFKRGQSLRRFKLNYNRLKRISKACLRHLEKLIELNLDHNDLGELESALFSSLLNLKSLSIAHNKLSELAAHQFVNLTNLVSLNLVGNSFKTIDLHLFEPMQDSLKLLLLAKNQINSFVYSPIQQQQQVVSNQQQNASNNQITKKLPQNWPQSLIPVLATTKSSALLSGVVFKNLIKLNVDHNRLERIKQLKLHRFFNVKYLSIRYNNIATIRDKAFNGLKLIELNLAHNQLVSISKCAFCNATIKRLVLSHNNITLTSPNQMLLEPPTSVLSSASPSLFSSSSNQLPRPLASVKSNETNSLSEPLAQKSDQASLSSDSITPPATSSQNMLILSQSIFGPLFGQLEYLDLSNNEMLADQLDYLLEPLLKLEYLNIAAVGIDRSLLSPNLFKNLHQLKYLNISNNQLDMLVAETVEPLTMLEVLDMSNNKFSELDESFLVTIDELTSLKVINFGSNPWFCSQCKVAPLYDWILRSQIYNYTCILPLAEMQERSQEESNIDNEDMDSLSANDDNLDKQTATDNEESIYKGIHDYSILLGDETVDELGTNIDFESILSSTSSSIGDDLINYNYLDSSRMNNGQTTLFKSNLLATTGEDDPSIAQTISTTSAYINHGSLFKFFNPSNYCLKCEFPRELHTFKIHELNPGDFKFCADGAPRFAASEPKIGLTLAIVIIGFLFLIIIVVIVMYRRKSNTYYTNEDTDALNGAKKPVLSISSDVEHQYGGDATDYSSPPMSQSYDSYSQDNDDDDDEEEDEDEEDDEEEEYEGEEYDDDEEEVIEDEGEIGSTEESRMGTKKSQRKGVIDEMDSQPDETAIASLDASTKSEEHHQNQHQTSNGHHNQQKQKPSGHLPSSTGAPTANELRPSSVATKSSERSAKGIRDKSQSSVQSNSGIKRISQQVLVEKPSWAPTSAQGDRTEPSMKSEMTQAGIEGGNKKSPASRQSSGGKTSNLNKLLSNESDSQSTTHSYARVGKQKRIIDANSVQKLKETQSGSFSLPKKRANKAKAPSDSLDLEPKGRDSWSGAQPSDPVKMQTPDVGSSSKLARGKQNTGIIYQLASSLRPSGQNSNESSNGTGDYDIRNKREANTSSDRKSKNSKNQLLLGHSYSHKLDARYVPSSIGPSRQHTADTPNSNSFRPAMSRQRFTAISNDLPDLQKSDSLVGFGFKDMSLITKQAEHLVREANAFQQVNPADVSSSNLSLPPPPASDFMQAIGKASAKKLVSTQGNTINNYEIAHQGRVHSPTSDATTADSLAMEALEYLANEFDDINDDDNNLLPTYSGDAINLEALDRGEALAELDASSLEYDSHKQHLTAPGSNDRGFGKSHSTHSALTQAGSREMGEF